MSYPYLPVNPCCTEVVLNTPCGCSSTITNGGCENPCGTHLTASSTIVYDGPVLPCIVAEPCDTLNVILQKIDEIICNLQTQINYLTNQVTNITNQIIMINGDIINIYNTLGECCGATTTTTSSSSSTTTTTTTLAPTTTTSTTIEPTTTTTSSSSSTSTTTSTSSSTSTTTTTTSSTSSTTTTTTTEFAGLCTCMTVTIAQTDLDDATGNTAPRINNAVYLNTIKDSSCDGSDIIRTYTDALSDFWCIKTASISTIQLFYYKNDVPIYYPSIDSTYTVLYSACSLNEDCEPTTTTTTTTIEPTTTTTTTPAFYSFNFTSNCDSGEEGGALCCPETIATQTFYSLDNPIVLGSVLYDSFGEVIGANLWYKDTISGIAYRIDNFGNVTGIYNCSALTTTTTTTV
jgi:hypothetical protein